MRDLTLLLLIAFLVGLPHQVITGGGGGKAQACTAQCTNSLGQNGGQGGPMSEKICQYECMGKGDSNDDDKLVAECARLFKVAVETLEKVKLEEPEDPKSLRRRDFKDSPITADEAGIPDNVQEPSMAQCNTYRPQNPDNINFKVGLTRRDGSTPVGSGRGSGICAAPSKPKEERLRRRQLVQGLTGFQKCIPLVSKVPMANPYHPSLTGLPLDKVVKRLGTGMAYSLTNKGVNCLKQTNPCPWSQSTSVSVSNAISFAISRGETVTATETNSTNWSKGGSEGVTNILSKASEDSITRTLAKTNSSSFSENLQDTFTKSNEITRGNTTTDTTENSWTNSRTWNRENSKTRTEANGYEFTALGGSEYTLNVGSSKDSINQESGDASLSVQCSKSKGWDQTTNFGISSDALQAGYAVTIKSQDDKSVTFSISKGAMKSKSLRNDCSRQRTDNNGKNYAVRHNCDNSHTITYSHGGTKAYTHGHTNAFANELRETDSISNAYMKGNTTETGWSITNTDAYGYATTNTYGTNTEKSKTFSDGSEHTDAYAKAKSEETSNTTTITITSSIETTQTMFLPPGTIGYPVCRPLVISEITPWSCIEEDGDVIYTTEVQVPASLQQSNNVSCILDFEDPGSPPRVFKHVAQRYLNIPDGAIMKFGYVMDPLRGTNVVDSLTNGDYTLKFDNPQSCNIGVFQGSNMIWSTGITNGYFNRSSSLSLKPRGCRMRVTTDGHLIQEALGVYINAPLDWTMAWSTQPYGIDYPVGVFGDKGYSLVLQADGELELLDGKDVRIWSSKLSKNRYGYKYPVMSIFPAIMPTESSLPAARDLHNTRPSNIKWLGDRLKLGSCDTMYMKSGEGIISPNGRFAVYLDQGGNMFIKDGERTMWQTQTMDMWYAKGPYRAGLDATGRFQIKDSGSKVIWSTETGGMDSMVIDNNGVFMGFTDSGFPTWTLRVDLKAAFYGHMTYSRPYISCDRCSECSLKGKTAPLYNLATGDCIPLSSTNPACRQFLYVEETKHYVAMSEQDPTVRSGLCLGARNETLGPCSPTVTWKHYNDYFLTMNHEKDACLGTNFTLTSCIGDDLRGTKLWSHGPSILESLDTGRNRLMYVGQRIEGFGASFQLGPNGNLILTNRRGSSKMVTSNKVFREKTVLELTVNGDLLVTNLYGNVTVQTVVGRKGVPPYKAFISSDGAFVIQDSKNITTYRFA
ncbi:hypothetical protein HDU67_008211 [Dinochytrium kinnereticum]|nr:hypothetical protein HDU67_008211 [Dinochytrium kinnereticum]